MVKLLYLWLAWETHCCQGYKKLLPPFTHTCTILPGNQIFAIKASSLIILKTKLRTVPWASRVPQSKFEAIQSRGFWVMIGQTNRRSKKQRLQLYIMRCVFFLFIFPSNCFVKLFWNLQFKNNYVFEKS